MGDFPLIWVYIWFIIDFNKQLIYNNIRIYTSYIYLYLTYIGSKNIYNLEKYIYKTLKNNKLSDKFIYINCTDNINDKKIINDLNDKLSIITDNEIVLPAIIYYKNEKPVDYIDSTNQILTGDKFVQLMDKWEVNKWLM